MSHYKSDDTWLAGKKIVVMLGAGGVGKTTCSAALAFRAASLGARVGLLSIDPARRLADALGLTLGGELSSVELPKDCKGCSGSVEAAMVDQKNIFDMMVQRHSPSASVATKILQHPIYQAASTKLAGPLEYMALAQLQSMADSGRYDLVVLDTPPDTQALDFLGRPNILASFSDSRVMNWLVKPFHVASRFGFSKIFSAGEKLMGGVAKVTGLQALKLIAEFLILIQQVIEGFQASGERVSTLLKSSSTGFILVTTPQQRALATAEHMASCLSELGYELGGVLFNRSLPRDVASALEHVCGKEQPTGAPVESLTLDHRLNVRRLAEIADVAAFRKSILKSPKAFMYQHLDEFFEAIDSSTAIWKVAQQLELCKASIAKKAC